LKQHDGNVLKFLHLDRKILNILICRNLLHKTDINKDGNISSDELKTWVASIRQSHAVKLTKERVAEYDSNNDGLVSMKEYFDAIYENIENKGIFSIYVHSKTPWLKISWFIKKKAVFGIT
jgi:hypothetical protein